MRIALFMFALMLGSCATAPPPPASIAYAWASFDADGVRDQGVSGFADRQQGRALTIDDPARIASISKLVVAMGVMKLVEQGRLDLDRDVSKWLGWPLRNPAFADRPITLRMLLSHRSSLVDEVDYAIPLGQGLEATLGNPEAFDKVHSPGNYFRYSNLNFPVVASVMEKATGERFDHVMERLVLGPLGLDACFNWTSCSDDAVARAVVLYDPGGHPIRDDLGGRRPICPVLAADGVPCELDQYRPGDNGALFSPQGGLRISVRDLIVIGRLVLNKGWHDGRRFLRHRSLSEMFSPQWRFIDQDKGDSETGFYCAYGLGVQLIPSNRPGCADDLFGGGRDMAGHAGDAYGLRSGLWVDEESKTGIAYFATGNGDNPPRGRTAYTVIEEWLASKLGD